MASYCVTCPWSPNLMNWSRWNCQSLIQNSNAIASATTCLLQRQPTSRPYHLRFRLQGTKREFGDILSAVLTFQHSVSRLLWEASSVRQKRKLGLHQRL